MPFQKYGKIAANYWLHNKTTDLRNVPKIVFKVLQVYDCAISITIEQIF